MPFLRVQPPNAGHYKCVPCNVQILPGSGLVAGLEALEVHPIGDYHDLLTRDAFLLDHEVSRAL